MLIREVQIRQPGRALQAVAIGVFSCLASASLAVAFLSLATGCHHVAPPPAIQNRERLGARWCDALPSCDSSCFTPAVLCESHTRLNFDGCRWACREYGP